KATRHFVSQQLTEYEYFQEMLNKKELPNHKKVKKIIDGEKEVKNTSKTMTQKSKNTSENSSSELPSSSDVGSKNDEEIKFDFTSVEIELLQEQSNKWEVGTVNVLQRFKKYQIEIIEKAKTYRIKWTLSSIIVLSLPCPYPTHIFTSWEWQTIIYKNPYIVADSVLSEILSSLRNVSADFLEGKTLFLSLSDSEIS
ncbi:24539_t:CDS:2, partial [Dentiscutata erythropus]